ncbi:hypothetical protein Tco_1258696, partial [Tanacetum coccineum]
ITFRSRKMSLLGNDDFSQHVSNDEASYQEDASDNGDATNKPKQQQQKVIQNGNSKKRISTEKDGVVKILPPVSLEAHGAEVSNEDANHKFLRSLPLAWSNLAMTMMTKPDVDTLSIDNLYNNLRVFESEIKDASKAAASAQNVAFVSQSKSSTSKVKSGYSTAYSTYNPSTSSNNKQEKEVPIGFADEVIYSLFATQLEDLDLLHEDLEHIDDVDIEDMDIN